LSIWSSLVVEVGVDSAAVVEVPEDLELVRGYLSRLVLTTPLQLAVVVRVAIRLLMVLTATIPYLAP